MRRVLVTTVAVASLTFTVYLAGGGDVSSQAAFLASLGLGTPTHVATCPVRISDACLAQAADAGVSVHRYERLKFPVVVTVLPDAGRDVQLPPLPQDVRTCIEVMDWSDCTLALVSSAPAVAAKWGQALPFGLGVTRRCVRPNRDGGLGCYRDAGTGTPWDFGDRNVFARVEAVDPVTCEPVECVIFAGDDPEKEL